MEDKRCLVEDCKADAEYTCPCSSPAVYACNQHAASHLDKDGETHSMTSIFIEPCKGTREAVLKFFTKLDSKQKKLKKKVLVSFSQRAVDAESDLKELIKKINSYSVELNNCFQKISQAERILKSEQDPILGLLSLQPEEAIEKVKMIIPSNPDWYDSSKMFCGFSQKIEKMIECFIKDKVEGYLDNRLAKIENTMEMHDKSISLANDEIANIKDSISNAINENKKRLREFEDWKEAMSIKTKSDAKLLNSQISSITEDLSRLKRAEENQSQNDISAAQNLRDTRTEACIKPNNSDLEQESKMACKTDESSQGAHSQSLTQLYQDCVKTYDHQTSLYNLDSKDGRTTLLIYNTETENKEEIIVQTPEPINQSTCIALLPNGSLFCYGKYPPTGITLIIDESGRVQALPSGTHCSLSSAIYYKDGVYCFGGWNDGPLTLSSRFDLDRTEWAELAPLTKADSLCSSIIFNGDILISGNDNRNLVRYSICSNSFTTIPFEFAEYKLKILINGERLYLIECNYGSMFESEIGSDTAWRRIADLATGLVLYQTYWLYNKGGVYIGSIHWQDSKKMLSYFKFNLSDKSLTALNNFVLQ